MIDGNVAPPEQPEKPKQPEQLEQPEQFYVYRNGMNIGGCTTITTNFNHMIYNIIDENDYAVLSSGHILADMNESCPNDVADLIDNNWGDGCFCVFQSIEALEDNLRSMRPDNPFGMKYNVDNSDPIDVVYVYTFKEILQRYMAGENVIML